MDRNFTRLLDMLRLVPVGRKISTADLHQRLTALGHEVTARTVQRDLLALATHYNLACDDRTKPFGWMWPAGAVRPVLTEMDLTQALAFTLLMRECKELMPSAVIDALQPWLDKAQSKLKQEGQTKASRWPQKVAIRPQGPPLLTAKVLRSTADSVMDALFSERQIAAEYRSAQSKCYRPVRLHPLGIVRTGLVSYLVATFDGFSDPRLLALHRLRGVQLQEQASLTPQGFNLDEYLGQDRLNFGSGKQVQLRLRMTRPAAAHLNDTPLSTDQTIDPAADAPSKIVVSATVNESPRLIWWLLGFGTQVEVLEPESVRLAIDRIRKF